MVYLLSRSIWSKNEAITFYSSMLLTKDGLLEQEKEQILVWINEIKSGNTGTGLFFLHFLHIAIICLLVGWLID